MNILVPCSRLIGRLVRVAPALILVFSSQTYVTAEVPRNEAATEKEDFLPLPRWSEQELRAFRENMPLMHHSGALLPEKEGTVTDINELLRTPLSSGPRLDNLFLKNDPELSPRLRAEDMRLFLPESTLGQSVQELRKDDTRLPTPLSSLQEVSPEFMAVCEQAMPKGYLMDPDLLVPEMQNHDMVRFLEFHARDARIKLHVLIMPHDRKLPTNVDLEKVASGGLMQTEACLLVYPLGEPWRAKLFMSRSVHDRTSPQFLSETVGACLQEALQASDVHDQLHRYAVHLSTRLFWLQRSLGNAGREDKEQPLAEFMPEGTDVPPPHLSSWLILALSFGSIAFLAVAAMAGRRVYHHQRIRRQKCVWLLPEPETVPRLGGAFTGGGGGVIRYG